MLDRAPPRAAARSLADRPPRPRPPLFPIGLVVDVETSDGEAGKGLAGWHVHHAQLGPGRCRLRQVGVHTGTMQIGYECWSLGMLKMGRVPPDAVTFLVPAGRRPARIQGRSYAAGEVVVLFDGDELDYRSAGPAELVSVSVERAALEGHVRGLIGPSFDELRLRGRLAELRADAAVLRGLCLDVAARAVSRRRLLRDPAKARSLEARVVRALFSECERPARPEARGGGRALALRAEAWLRRNLAEPPTIAALCQALGASERTLHEAFREHLGTTPKAYVKTLRLNAAHHDLLNGAARATVTDVALDWGFLHFGWFSQDYRRLFGETPSQTLQRGRVRSGAGLAALSRGIVLPLGA
jgi:AraC family ethanolamine operon transcriptional activator